MIPTIYRRLTSSEELCALLAKHFDLPAIFYQKAPADTDDVTISYPQIIFTVDKYSDAIHGVAGLLTVEIFTAQLTESSPPEPIEKLVRALLKGIFFKPKDGEIFSLRWQKSDVFTEPASERTPLLIGTEMIFEIYEWSKAETTEPDPIAALNFWAQSWNENLIVIGLTEFENFIIPTRDNPAIFFDTQTLRSIQQKSATTWFESRITAHLFAPSVKVKREWLTALEFALTLNERGRITLEGGEPMFLQQAEINFSSSEVDGQLTLTYEFGLTREVPYAHPIANRFLREDSKIKRWR